MSVQLVGRVAIMKSGRCEETPERYDCCHLPPKEVDGGAMERTTNARTHCQGDVGRLRIGFEGREYNMQEIDVHEN